MAQEKISLEALIGEVEARSKTFALGEPAPPLAELDRLGAAVMLAGEVGGVADALVDHFVTAARAAGCSWAQIGGVLGVTKQAAQQRFVEVTPAGDLVDAGFESTTSGRKGSGRRWWRRGLPFWQRFTGGARAVVVNAQMDAGSLNHDYIGTEHLLLGLLHDGLAAETLAALGVTPDEVRRRILDIVGPGRRDTGGHIPFTPRAKKVLELSLREALELKHNYIGTEHILLGLLREGEGLALKILTELGAPPAAVRKELLGRLTPPADPTL